MGVGKLIGHMLGMPLPEVWERFRQAGWSYFVYRQAWELWDLCEDVLRQDDNELARDVLDWLEETGALQKSAIFRVQKAKEIRDKIWKYSDRLEKELVR